MTLDFCCGVFILSGVASYGLDCASFGLILGSLEDCEYCIYLIRLLNYILVVFVKYDLHFFKVRI
jgi:hypothetical protein